MHDYFNVKMRAQRLGVHVSGAERLVGREYIETAMRDLTARAMTHPNGEPDSVVVTVDRLDGPPRRIRALAVTQPDSASPGQARELLRAEMERLGLDACRVLDLFYALEKMRGAALVDATTLERLEPDCDRGVRATRMDFTGNRGGAKNHMKEALCLATKVAHCPGIVGELCMSDDPDYTTGYFASKERGYVRLTNMKSMGDPRGGRLFLFKGSRADLAACMRFLEKTPVLVEME